MNILNIEIKSPCHNPEIIEHLLLEHHAVFKGEDHQIDTYFKVDHGRLKLRQGNIENTLIQYHRVETEGLKKSEVSLQKLPSETEGLKSILTHQLGIWKVVDKKRKIFFIENVKFHIDQVKNLGSFVEIEAIDQEGNKDQEALEKQCNYFIKYLNLDPNHFIAQSYSDLIV